MSGVAAGTASRSASADGTGPPSCHATLHVLCCMPQLRCMLYATVHVVCCMPHVRRMLYATVHVVWSMPHDLHCIVRVGPTALAHRSTGLVATGRGTHTCVGECHGPKSSGSA